LLSAHVQRCGILLSPRLFASQSNAQHGDLVAVDGVVEVGAEGIGNAGLVVVAVYRGGDGSLAVAVSHVDDIEGDLDADDFAVAPQ
jgi:hypothetical protein